MFVTSQDLYNQNECEQLHNAKILQFEWSINATKSTDSVIESDEKQS